MSDAEHKVLKMSHTQQSVTTLLYGWQQFFPQEPQPPAGHVLNWLRTTDDRIEPILAVFESTARRIEQGQIIFNVSGYLRTMLRNYDEGTRAKNLKNPVRTLRRAA